MLSEEPDAVVETEDNGKAVELLMFSDEDSVSFLKLLVPLDRLLTLRCQQQII